MINGLYIEFMAIGLSLAHSVARFGVSRHHQQARVLACLKVLRFYRIELYL